MTVGLKGGTHNAIDFLLPLHWRRGRRMAPPPTLSALLAGRGCHAATPFPRRPIALGEPTHGTVVKVISNVVVSLSRRTLTLTVSPGLWRSSVSSRSAEDLTRRPSTAVMISPN